MVQAYEALEAEIGAAFGESHVVCCSSGTAALHLALEALRLPQGSEVLLPDFTMVACARAVSMAGLIPVFVDCGPDLCMSPDDLVLKLRGRPSVMLALAVHVYGRRCNMDTITQICGERGVMVMEDLAEAHGVERHPESVAACWSFYRNKIVAGEEGGAVAFRNKSNAEMARSLRCLGFTAAHDFEHIPRGHNYRLSNLHAQPIRASLAKLTDTLAIHGEQARVIERALPAQWVLPPRSVTWVCDFRIPGLEREAQNQMVRLLQELGIPARHGFKPMSSQREYLDDKGGQKCPRSYRASREVLYVPLGCGVLPGMIALAITQAAVSAGVLP